MSLDSIQNTSELSKPLILQRASSRLFWCEKWVKADPGEPQAHFPKIASAAVIKSFSGL
jgi:hypothetical protein